MTETKPKPDEFDENINAEDRYMTDEEVLQENNTIVIVLVAWVIFGGITMLNLYMGLSIPPIIFYVSGGILILIAIALIDYFIDW